MRTLPVPDPGTPDHRGPWRYLAWILRSQAHSIGPAMLLGILWMLTQALMPAAIGRAIDAGVTARDGGALGRWALVLLGLGAVQAFSGVMRHRYAVFNWLAAAYRSIQVVTRQATRLGATLPKRTTSGEVVSVGLADVARIGDAADIVARGSGAVVSIFVVTIILLGAMWQLGLVVLVGVPLILALTAPLLRPLHRRQARQRELAGELTTRAADIVAGLRVLRGIGGEELFARRFREESQDVRRAGVRTAAAEAGLEGATVLLPGLLLVAVTWMGAHYAAEGVITPGELVAFYGYAAFLVIPLWTLGEAADKVAKAHVAAGRIVRVLDLEPEFPGAGTAEPGPGGLADPASGLRVPSGLLTAVVAGDEAGALADRLGGYADGASYGGVPLAELAGLRKRILVAVNEDRLFTGTLGAELGRGDRIERAIRTACAEDVVEAVGLDGPVAEGGREFSGGQQQRLRLARALAAEPEVLVLVEPTSAVDAHTEARIAARLGEHRAGRTTVVFTASPLVLDRADHVVFVSGGKVVAEGGHHELLAGCPPYRAAVTRDDPMTVEGRR